MQRKLKISEIAAVRSEVLKQQGGSCPLCGIDIEAEGKKPALDHDHTLGHVRGVLCFNCNGSEGRIKHILYRTRRKLSSEEWLTNLISYWQHHKESRHGLIHPKHVTADEKKQRAAAKKKKVIH